MSSIRVTNIQTKADASSPTVDEKLKILNSQGNTVMQVDAKTSGITTVGINTTGNTFTVDSNNGVTFAGVVTASSFSGSGANLTGIAATTDVRTNSLVVSGVSTVTTLNATSIVGVTTAGITTAYIGSVNDGPISGTRNRIINGDMRIDQRNAGASVSVTDNTFTVDRFKYVGSSSRITAQRSTSSLPVGFDYALLLTSVGANTPSSEANAIWQIIEANNVSDLAYGTANAKTITLSFLVRSSAAVTYGGAIQNANLTRSFPFSYTIIAANTWEYKTITIPGDTSGTWNTTGTSGGLTVVFSVGASSGFKGTANAWAGADYRDVTGTSNLQATNGATLSLTGVQLEAGSVATPFERRSFGQELALCQRYFFNGGTITQYAPGYSVNARGAGGWIAFPTTMRADSPTVILSSITYTGSNSLSALTRMRNGFAAYYVAAADNTTAVTFDYTASIEL